MEADFRTIDVWPLVIAHCVWSGGWSEWEDGCCTR